MRRLLASFVLASALAAAVPALAVEVGEKAPEFDLTGWAQGEPLKVADGIGRSTLLVCFWATFDTECVEAAPEISRIYDKHKAKGLEVVLVSTEPADDVKKFLAEHKVSCRVAIDQNHNTQAEWAKDVRKLPFACLVDKTGTVVWKGDPSRGLESVLEEVLAGTFDAKRAVEIETRHRAIEEAFQNQDFEALAKACDKLLETDPTDEYAFTWRVFTFQFGGGDEKQAELRTWLRSLADRSKDHAKTQARIAGQAVDGGIESRDVELAYACAKRAVDLTKSGDADVLDTWADVLYALGLVEQCVDQTKKAIALEPADEDRKKRLAYFEGVLAVRKKAAAPPPPGPTPPKKK